MCPDILGFNNSSYILMIIIGVVLALGLAILYLRKHKFKKNDIIDLLICGCFAVAFGILFAWIFEMINEWKFTTGLTFFGGLFGGIFGFLFVYFVFLRKKSTLPMDKIIIVAPACITLGHGIGRIGCFMAGCCYGKETDAWYGLPCAWDKPGVNVIPTQLFEAIFLLILTGILVLLIFKWDFKYTFIVYLGSYSIWRFLLEFLRSDNRGNFIFGVISPSQMWCIVIWIIIVPLFFFLKYIVFKDTNKKELKNEKS